MSETEHGGPVVRAPRGEQEPTRRPRWPRAVGAAVGILAVATVGGFWWRRRARRRRVEEDLPPLSQEWLAEHYYTSGQRGDDD